MHTEAIPNFQGDVGIVVEDDRRRGRSGFYFWLRWCNCLWRGRIPEDVHLKCAGVFGFCLVQGFRSVSRSDFGFYGLAISQANPHLERLNDLQATVFQAWLLTIL